ncbi:MAG: endonuclease/exonuclease/phosphatase family protein [Bacteroidales bacterium]|nr:endonuclease/exonuclease/phosphatase family protein [Bacteroidales bacterium]
MTKSGFWIFRLGVKMLILLVNLLFIFLLLLTYLAPSISPDRFFAPAMLGLVYPLLFVINLLFMTFWLVRLKYYFLFSLISLALGWNVMKVNVGLNTKAPDENQAGNIKFLSYNVRLFDQFKWMPGQDYFTRNNIFNFITTESPDIVNFQEFFHGSETYFPTIGPFLESQKTSHYHTDYIKVVGTNKHYGLATFSRFPIVNRGSIRFGNSTSNSGMFTDIVVNRDTVRVFNFHFESIRLSNADYKFVTEFIDPGMHPTSSNSRIILGKFHNAFVKRAEQARIAKEHIAQSPYPVIVSGDFNDTPVSYVYHQISSGLNDAFIESGTGFGSTYAGNIPFIRIDYILHSDQLRAQGYQTHKVSFSDHYPISCDFLLPLQ